MILLKRRPEVTLFEVLTTLLADMQSLGLTKIEAGRRQKARQRGETSDGRPAHHEQEGSGLTLE